MHKGPQTTLGDKARHYQEDGLGHK